MEQEWMAEVTNCMNCTPTPLVFKNVGEILNATREPLRCMTCGFVSSVVKVADRPDLRGLPLQNEYTIVCEAPQAKA